MEASDAEKLVRAFWPARERALSGRDTLAVRELEAGSAAEWDAVGCTIARATTSAREIAGLRVFVPRQAGHPAAFLAPALTTASHNTTAPIVALVVLTPTSAAAP